MSPSASTAAETPQLQSQAGRDARLERSLTERGFEWEWLGEIPVELVDQPRSLNNQARMGHPLNANTVARYVAALGNGDEFPGIVTSGELKVAGLLIADGNHRFEAFKKAGRKTIPAYRLNNVRPPVLAQYTFEANTKHGLPTSDEDRLRHALYMVDNGTSQTDAARLLSLPILKVRNAVNLANADRRAVENRINRPLWDKLAQALRLRLNQLDDDEIFTEVTNLTLQAALSADEVNAIINNLAQLRSHSKKLDILKTVRQGLAERLQKGGQRGKKGRQSLSPRGQVSMWLGHGMQLPAIESVVERMSEADKEEMLGRVDGVVRQLNELKKALRG